MIAARPFAIGQSHRLAAVFLPAEGFDVALGKVVKHLERDGGKGAFRVVPLDRRSDYDFAIAAVLSSCPNVRIVDHSAALFERADGIPLVLALVELLPN